MYPARLGFGVAKSRINQLLQNEHYAEALLTSVFTFEKTIHRTLKQLMVSAGFRNRDADRLLRRIRGFNNQKEVWSCFDPWGDSLPDIIGNAHWQHIRSAVTMRNQLVHGARVYSLDECKKMAENILELVDQAVLSFEARYGFDGWKKISIRRKPTLHSDPKVRRAAT